MEHNTASCAWYECPEKARRGEYYCTWHIPYAPVDNSRLIYDAQDMVQNLVAGGQEDIGTQRMIEYLQAQIGRWQEAPNVEGGNNITRRLLRVRREREGNDDDCVIVSETSRRSDDDCVIVSVTLAKR